MFDPELVKDCIRDKRINLCGDVFNMSHLELALIVLNATGEIRIENCAGVVTMMEMGAYLSSLYTEANKEKQ